jgi:hypothetical protein
MDLVLDKDIRQISSLKEFYLYLFERTRSTLEEVYFAVEEEGNGYLIKSENDFEAMKNFCEKLQKFFPRIFVKNESFPDFRIVEEEGTTNGALVRVESDYWKEWTIQSIGPAYISHIASKCLQNLFSFEKIEENLYIVKFRYSVKKKDLEFNFTAQLYYEGAPYPIGPELWINFRT